MLGRRHLLAGLGAMAAAPAVAATRPPAGPQRRLDQRLVRPPLIYEYACHKGNPSLPSILSAARQGRQDH